MRSSWLLCHWPPQALHVVPFTVVFTRWAYMFPVYSIQTPCCVPGGSRRARVSNNWVSHIFRVSVLKGIDWKELRGTSFGEASEWVVLWGSPTWNKTLQGHLSSEVTLDILIDRNLGFKSEKKTSFSRSIFFLLRYDLAIWLRQPWTWVWMSGKLKRPDRMRLPETE